MFARLVCQKGQWMSFHWAESHPGPNWWHLTSQNLIATFKRYCSGALQVKLNHPGFLNVYLNLSTSVLLHKTVARMESSLEWKPLPLFCLYNAIAIVTPQKSLQSSLWTTDERFGHKHWPHRGHEALVWVGSIKKPTMSTVNHYLYK